MQRIKNLESNFLLVIAFIDGKHTIACLSQFMVTKNVQDRNNEGERKVHDLHQCIPLIMRCATSSYHGIKS